MNLPESTIPRLAGGVLALLFVAGGCKPREEAAGPQGPPRAMVTVATAVARDVPVYLDEIGKCTAFEMVTVAPQIPGRLEGIHFTDGAELKKGQLLFTIDARPYQAALDQAQAALEQSQAALVFAHLELKRDEQLLETKAVAQSDYDTKKNAVDVGVAQEAAARAAVETARLNFEYCTIRSPIDGRAGQRLVDVGNILKTPDSSLLVIQRLDPIYADFTITERDLPGVQAEMAKGTLKATVHLSDDLLPPRDGDLTFLDNAVQDGTGTVRLRVTLPNQDHHFWPGQYVQIRLVLRVKKDAVLVPSVATQLGQKGRYVYVIKRDDTAEIRPVVLGQSQGDDVVIEQGVGPGERVVIIGQVGIIPSLPVTIVAPTTAPSAPVPGAQADVEGGKP